MHLHLAQQYGEAKASTWIIPYCTWLTFAVMLIHLCVMCSDWLKHWHSTALFRRFNTKFYYDIDVLTAKQTHSLQDVCTCNC